MNVSILKRLLKIGLLALVFATNVHAAADHTYIEGVDYITLPADLRTNQDVAQLMMNDPNKIQLLYFFSYGCAACARFDPAFATWANMHKNKRIVIYKFPVSFHEEWKNLAKMFYVMKALDPKETLNSKIFVAIHEQKLPLWQIPEMKKFFVDNGISAADFDKTINSFSINQNMQQANQLINAYGISASPTIVINGPKAMYKLDQKDADTSKFFSLIDDLLQTELKS